MNISKIQDLALYLSAPVSYVGYMERDSQLNIGGWESQHFPAPEQAFAAAQAYAKDCRYTRLSYGVHAHIGDDVVVTEVEGFSGTT